MRNEFIYNAFTRYIARNRALRTVVDAIGSDRLFNVLYSDVYYLIGSIPYDKILTKTEVDRLTHALSLDPDQRYGMLIQPVFKGIRNARRFNSQHGVPTHAYRYRFPAYLFDPEYNIMEG